MFMSEADVRDVDRDGLGTRTVEVKTSKDGGGSSIWRYAKGGKRGRLAARLSLSRPAQAICLLAGRTSGHLSGRPGPLPTGKQHCTT